MLWYKSTSIAQELQHHFCHKRGSNEGAPLLGDKERSGELTGYALNLIFLKTSFLHCYLSRM